MNESAKAFLRNSAVVQRNVGVETILYTSQMDVVHVLNRTARLVWDLCDGAHTFADIEQAVREQFAVGVNYDLYPDIHRAIEVLLEKGLVVAVDRAG
jgi:hypothetical protein